jgi:hypothetical protein
MPITPSTVTLTDLQTQQFALSTGSATWSISPTHGTIDVNNGLYVAPGIVTAAEDVVVTAMPVGGGVSSLAVIRLQPRMTIIPGNVSLKAGESQQFDVTVIGDPKNAVTWVASPTVGEMQAGLYKAPPVVRDPAVITITAKSMIDQTKSTSASVHLVPSQPFWLWVLTLGVYLTGLFLLAAPLILSWPPPAEGTAFTVAPESEAKIQEPAAQPAAQKSAETGKKVPESLEKATVAKDNAASGQAAKAGSDAQSRPGKAAAQKGAAEISAAQRDMIDTPFGKVTRDVDLMLLVLLAGALGAWIHVGRSYVDFVGNRAFRVSWIPWYVLHPLLGSALALVFYLAVRGGFFMTGTRGTDVNPYGITGVAALVGLFSKQATNKLAEVFDTLFKTDKGKDLKDKLDPQSKTS